MSREANDANDPDANDSSDGVNETPTERLARETNTPLEAVKQIYEIETAELSRTARIKSYVDVLALHRTRVLLAGREEPSLE